MGPIISRDLISLLELSTTVKYNHHQKLSIQDKQLELRLVRLQYIVALDGNIQIFYVAATQFFLEKYPKWVILKQDNQSQMLLFSLPIIYNVTTKETIPNQLNSSEETCGQPKGYEPSED